MKKWQDQKNSFGILIYALCRFQNYKNPLGRIDNWPEGIRCIKKGFEETICYQAISDKKVSTKSAILSFS